MRSILGTIVKMLVFLALITAGCASTTLRTDWKDPAYSGRFKKVLVICVVEQMVVRNTLEDELAAELGQRGVAAVQSYRFFPSLESIDRDAVRARVREIHADGVFLARRTSKESIQNMTASFDTVSNYYEQWGTFAQAYQAPQATVVDRYRVETSLYEAAGGKIVWQALSETYDDNSLAKVIKSFAQLMANKLSEQGLI